MIDIIVKSYYADQLEHAFYDAYKYGEEKKKVQNMGNNDNGQEVFIISDESLPADLTYFLEEELGDNGDIKLGEREIDTTDEDAEEPGNIYEVNIHY